MTTLPVLRRSAIQSAQSCLHRFNQIWNLGVPDQNDFSLRGIAFHAAAHRYITRLWDQKLEADEEEARLAFPEGIAAALTPAHLVPEVHDLYMRWARNFVLDLPAFLTAEEHQIGNNEHTFTPDLVYGRPSGLEIIDFKTFFQGMTEVQVKADWQARWYVFNAMRIWKNFPSYTFTHSYVRFGTQVSVTFTPDDFTTFSDEVSAVAASITEAKERNEWPATAGVECSFCSLACPLVDDPAVIPKRLTVPEQAVAVGGVILAMEAWLRNAKKTLKTYCAANGPVDVGGVIWDNRPVMQRAYPIDQVLDELHKMGVDKDAAVLATDNYSLTISHSALTKIFRAYPGLETNLQAAQRQKLTYRFSAKKPGADDEEPE